MKEFFQNCDSIKLCPSVFFIEDWNKCFNMSIPSRIRPLNKYALITQLMARCPFSLNERNRVWQTHILLEMPKDFDFQKLRNLTVPKQPLFGFIWNEVMAKYKKRVNENFFVLITREAFQLKYKNKSDQMLCRLRAVQKVNLTNLDTILYANRLKRKLPRI